MTGAPPLLEEQGGIETVRRPRVVLKARKEGGAGGEGVVAIKKVEGAESSPWPLTLTPLYRTRYVLPRTSEVIVRVVERGEALGILVN